MELLKKWLSVSQHIPGNNDFLNIGGSLNHLERLAVPQEAFNRVFGGKAVGAKNLAGLIGGVNSRFSGKILGHRGFKGGAPRRFILQGSRLIHQQLRRLVLNHHLGNGSLDHLEIGDGPTKLGPLLGVLDAGVDAALANAHGPGRAAQAGDIQHLHADFKALAQLPDQVFLGNFDVFKIDFAGGSAVEAKLGFNGFLGDALAVHVDDKSGNPPVLRLRIRIRNRVHYPQIGVGNVGNPHFVAVENKAVVLFHCPGFH